MTDDAFDMLVQQVESSADWRANKADQYPDDTRNVRSSKALYKLAENLKELPAGDEHAAAYNDLMGRAIEKGLDDALNEITGESSSFIGRYGFNYPQDGNPAGFLDALTEICRGIVEEAEEQLAKAEEEERFEAAQEA